MRRGHPEPCRIGHRSLFAVVVAGKGRQGILGTHTALPPSAPMSRGLRLQKQVKDEIIRSSRRMAITAPNGGWGPSEPRGGFVWLHRSPQPRARPDLEVSRAHNHLIAS